MKSIFKFLIIISSVYFNFIYLNATNIIDIKIEGNKRVSDETIIVYGDIKINQNIDSTKINQILNNLYATDFFKDIQIEEVNGILNIKVIEYTLINQLIITGEPSSKVKEQIEKLISTKSKRSLIESRISDDVNIIKKLYSSIGYNFANIDVKVKELDSENVDILIDINRGKVTKISSMSPILEDGIFL